MKYILYITLIAFIATLQSSCTRKFEEYNKDPNGVDTSMLKYDDVGLSAFFPQMQAAVVIAAKGPGDPSTYQVAQNLNADMYAGYAGTATMGFQSQNGTYNFNQNWNNSAFTHPYNNIISPWLNVKLRTQTQYPQLYALANIIKVAGMHRTTDVFGPIPYTKVGAGGFAASYDSQQEIYQSFFKELDSAILILTEFRKNNPDIPIVPKFDIVYGGDVLKWIKFANSLKLRLAIRIRMVDPTLAKTMAESAVNNEFGVLTDSKDNATYHSSNGIIVYNGLWNVDDNYGDTQAGAVLISLMNGYKDPRIDKYYTPHTLADSLFAKTSNPKILDSVPEFIGIRNGINVKVNKDRRPYSRIFGGPTDPIPWMYASEMYFARAEGALLGWDMGGTAKSMYELGIQTSFTQYGLSAGAYMEDDSSTAEPYRDPIELSGVNDVPANSRYLSKITIKWDEGSTPNEKLERIITQKYIAMFPLSYEAWSEFRRTGYPKIWPVVVNNSRGTIPTDLQVRRLPYPQPQKNSNPSGVSEGVSKLGGPDNGGTRLWWDVVDKSF